MYIRDFSDQLHNDNLRRLEKSLLGDGTRFFIFVKNYISKFQYPKNMTIFKLKKYMRMRHKLEL